MDPYKQKSISALAIHAWKAILFLAQLKRKRADFPQVLRTEEGGKRGSSKINGGRGGEGGFVKIPVKEFSCQ